MSSEQLIEKIRENAFRRDDNTILKHIANFYGFTHLSYLGLYVGATANRQGPLYVSTYPAEWLDHYIKMGYFKKDPTIKLALESLLPFDWSTIGKPTPLTKRMFGEAREFGISETGLSFPIRGYNGEVALMTMTGDFNAQQWRQFKQENIGDLLMVAIHVHLMVMASFERKVERPSLSPRETEALSWASQGKTYRDIAGILKISERTVRFYLENARHKLDALSITHAVARGISMRIIPPSL
jgi:DNA-binding CsgD family transcriptional regulator